MAARPATFTEFDPFKLTGVRVTDRELGHGSYATVLELEYVGLKCAGKRIHEILLRQGNDSYSVRRFEEECRLLSQVCHPNIVQFLGVYFQQGVQAPILVMEFLPTNLTSCIKQYGILPKEISYSILHDVALGFSYLHSQTPPIIHRDLSSNNVLLTPNMTAKIADLGVARILNLTPLQVSHMTQTPGTPAYMPPEVMVANPIYNKTVDEFSYGIMMIHMFSGRWPEPQVGPNRTEPDGTMIPVSEAERREVFLQAIGNDHPMMALILKCIHNHPQARAHACEIVERLADMVLQFPVSFANQLEMLRRIEADGKEKRTLTLERVRKDMVIKRKDRVIKNKEDEIMLNRKRFQAEKEQQLVEISRLKIAHASEVEQLQLQIRDLNTQNRLIKAKNEAEVTELKSMAGALETLVADNSKILLQLKEQSARQLMEEREQHEVELRKERELLEFQLGKEKEQYDIQLNKERKRYDILLAKEREQHEIQLAKERWQFAEERETNKKQMVDCQNLQFEITALQGANLKLQSDITGKNITIRLKNASVKRKDSELEAKNRALEEKDVTISAMSEQLTKLREYLSTKQQTLQTSITWKQCTKLPFGSSLAKATVINGKVYCGGGWNAGNEECIVYCYDTSQDKWTTLPLLPVKCFGLGQVSSKLVAVAGVKSGCLTPTSMVYTYDEQSKKWKQTIPPMPTVRCFPSVLSLQSALVGAGGYVLPSYRAAVEIFKPDTSQWYRTDPLPTACENISIVAIGNTCYALGGWNGSNLNQVLYTSVDDLLGNAVPANQTTHSGSSDTQSAWKTLPNTPTYTPAAAMLAGNLLAIGGKETSDWSSAVKKEVYMYSPSTNSWIYISDLPAPRSGATVALLSPTEILVIGGWDGGLVNTVYKGTLVNVVHKGTLTLI